MLLLFGFWARAAPNAGAGSITQVRVAGVAVTVEVADDHRARRQGLMGRRTLAPDHGMLFVYPDEQPLVFWMKNTPIDLDIGFFDARGRLLNVETMAALDTSRRYRSAGPARFALEVNAGWFDRHRVGPGARLQVPPPWMPPAAE